MGVFEYMAAARIRRLRIRASTVTMLPSGSDIWMRLPLEQNPIYGFLLLTDLLLGQLGHEEFVIYYETVPGTKFIFKGMLAIYSRDLGPAVTGIRVNHYETEEDMVEDAVMISRLMARKASIAGLPLGGGQMVVDYAKPHDFAYHRPQIFPFLEYIGSIIEEYGGAVIAAPDLNTSMNNMHIVQRTSRHVICNVAQNSYIKVENGLEEPGSLNGSGDPSPFAAYSVLQCLKAGTRFLLNDSKASLSGRKILVIGLGRTGLALIDYLLKEGAIIFGSDIDEGTCTIIEETYPVKILARTREELSEVHRFPCHAIAPCAVGGLISDKRIHEFETKIICGTANHQLNTDKDAILLQKRNILYIPDFIANSGGLLNAAQEVEFQDGIAHYRQNYDQIEVRKQIDAVVPVLEEILMTARKEDLSPQEVSLNVSDSRLLTKRKARWRSDAIA